MLYSYIGRTAVCLTRNSVALHIPRIVLVYTSLENMLLPGDHVPSLVELYYSSGIPHVHACTGAIPGLIGPVCTLQTRRLGDLVPRPNSCNSEIEISG